MVLYHPPSLPGFHALIQSTGGPLKTTLSLAKQSLDQAKQGYHDVAEPLLKSAVETVTPVLHKSVDIGTPIIKVAISYVKASWS